MGMANVKFGFGASARRVEDQAFLTGQGRYTDDIAPQGCLHGYVLRSPVAAGTFTMSADSLEAARTAPGVHLVLTGADTADLGDLTSPMYSVLPQLKEETPRNIPVLCRDTVRHVGDAVAFIVAESRAQAMDAAELIEVDYEPSAAVTETARALDADAPLVWPDAKNNHAFTYHRGSKEEADAAFAKAAHVTKVAFVNNRLVCNYMEPRAAIGDWRDDGITLTTGSQGVFGMRRLLCQNVFRIELERMRVITPDVGGGFGPKSWIYRENILVMEAVRRLKKPVKWVCDRTEHFLTDAQGRDNLVEAEMAMDAKGRFLALRINLVANMGAYISKNAIFIPYLGAMIGGSLAIGLALFQFWGDWVSIGVVAGIFVLGQVVEGNILTPRLVGHSVGLHPVWLLLALSVFGALFGFVGMLVAVPVAAALGVLARFGVEQYRSSRLYTGISDPDDP